MLIWTGEVLNKMVNSDMTEKNELSSFNNNS